MGAARRFHTPAKGRYGIAWKAVRGMPIASTFMFLMGCCGESLPPHPKEPAFPGARLSRAQQQLLPAGPNPRRACACSSYLQ